MCRFIGQECLRATAVQHLDINRSVAEQNPSAWKKFIQSVCSFELCCSLSFALIIWLQKLSEQDQIFTNYIDHWPEHLYVEEWFARLRSGDRGMSSTHQAIYDTARKKRRQHTTSRCAEGFGGHSKELMPARSSVRVDVVSRIALHV